jgi:hypothetical protein
MQHYKYAEHTEVLQFPLNTSYPKKLIQQDFGLSIAYVDAIDSVLLRAQLKFGHRVHATSSACYKKLSSL